jgi:hypothetical protein
VPNSESPSKAAWDRKRPPRSCERAHSSSSEQGAHLGVGTSKTLSPLLVGGTSATLVQSLTQFASVDFSDPDGPITT